MSVPSDNDIFIPLPPPVEDNGTPILKWVLSRPNAHIFPLHLLTTARSLHVVKEEIVVGYEDEESLDDDVTSSSFCPSSLLLDYDENPHDVSDEQGFEYGDEREMKEEEEVIEEEDQSPALSAPSLSFDNDVFLQNPHGERSTTTIDQGDQRGFSLLPPISTLFPVLPPFPPLLQLPDGLQQLIGLSELMQQQREFAAMQQLQHMTLFNPMLQIEQWFGVHPPLLLHPLQRAREELAHDLSENGEEEIDVVNGGDDGHEYTPVLPPSPVAEKIPEDDAIKTEETVRERVQKIFDSYSNKTHSFSKGAKKQRQPRLVLSRRQRNVFSGIIARGVSHLWPSERATIAKAFGITDRQVLNVFINRGGRAAQRREIGMSTQETQGIIREELAKSGFIP